jgi:hypothetical protein
VASHCLVVTIEFHQKEQILRRVRTFKRFGENIEILDEAVRGCWASAWQRGLRSVGATKIKETKPVLTRHSAGKCAIFD